MRSVDEHIAGSDGDGDRELRLLEELDSSPDISQRQIASRLGIALGVANLLVRNLAKKGYIKVTHLGWRRWVYVVTPKGMSRKVQLTLSYIERFVDHYRRVRRMLREEIASLPLNAESQVALVGTSELAELAYLALRDLGVEEIEVFGVDGAGPRFLGMPVRALESMEPSRYAKVVIAPPGGRSSWLQKLNSSGVSESQIVELLRSPIGSVSADDQSEDYR